MNKFSKFSLFYSLICVSILILLILSIQNDNSNFLQGTYVCDSGMSMTFSFNNRDRIFWINSRDLTDEGNFEISGNEYILDGDSLKSQRIEYNHKEDSFTFEIDGLEVKFINLSKVPTVIAVE